jgi:Zn-dependent M28 family amino/carboxypeptidase
MKKFLAFILVLFITGVPVAQAQKVAKNIKPGSAGAAPAPKYGNTDGITADQLRKYLTFIASDELEGRDTPSRGLDIAAMYIAEHLAGWGIKPGGDNGTYFQKFAIKRSKIDPAGTRLDLNGQNYSYGDDFLACFAAGNASGNLVYAGTGWVIKAKNIDSYAGIDVKDKIVVVTGGLPKGITFLDLQGGKPGVDWFSPAGYAIANGAKAVISFPSFGGLANWQGTKWTQSEKGAVFFGDDGNQATVPQVTASPRLLNILFAGEKSSAANIFNKAAAGEHLAGFDLSPAKRVSVSVALKHENTGSQNVIGILEGSDPVLKNEYVAIGAHYDHVGSNPFAPGEDKIWNGADDDGSGTVSVLSIAEAFAKGVRPKRSMLFIWHAGEEHGLWGSEYFSDHPTVPITSIITELNIDMIGRFQNPGDENHPQNKELPKPGEIFLIGSRMMSNDLGDVSEATNKGFLNLSFNYKYDDPNDTNRYFYRSDHFNYARKGIPIIFYMDGSHADYHQPSDTIEKINFPEMEKVARTIFATGWELANRAARPKVDKPLPASVIGN